MNTFFVDCALNLIQRIPVPVQHNLQKSLMIKNLMFQLNVDGTPGDYFEFGVAQGNSLKAAVLARTYAGYDPLGIKRLPRRIYGFDTFEGFRSSEPKDNHSTWKGNLYNHSFNKVSKRFKREQDFILAKIDVCILTNNSEVSIQHQNFEISSDTRAGLILMDMDLYAPTKSALIWVKPLLQSGTFVMFDEYHAFRGQNDKGERRALAEFLDENPDLSFDYVCDYGSGGRVFIVHV